MTRLAPAAILAVGLAAGAAQIVTPQTPRRNVIIFVADGLRHDSVSESETPALWRVRTEGVHFENSYSVFPTFTTANASAIATGHGLGDTGDFSNTIWIGYPTFDTGNFGRGPATSVPFIENDEILADLHDHFGGNYLGEQTLLELAAEQGYNTASVGKVGPVAIQMPAAVRAMSGAFPFPSSSAIVVDDATGTANGVALPRRLLDRLLKEHIIPEAPSRSNGYSATSAYNNGYAGTYARAGTLAPNVLQQQWLLDVTTRGVLPLFEEDQKPFALLFWSRDPDATQHNHGDSFNGLFPGINGPTSREAVRNADRSLAQLLAWLDAHPAIKANTDLFVTSDHGFATISRREIDRAGHATAAESAAHDYVDAAGAIETPKGTLPFGFLAIDLSLDLHLDLYDPDRHAESRVPFHRVRLTFDAWEHPLNGNGLLATAAGVVKVDGSDARVIVAANGGSDLIYVPNGDAEVVRQIVGAVMTHDYVGGVFVDDKYGEIPGTLPLSAAGLIGATKLPRPAIVVVFKVFYFNPSDVKTAVQISDAGLQEGQGMHGGLGRDSTYNNMAAIGPDFKTRFADPAPAGNADIAPTLASVMGLKLKPVGMLRGRTLSEALAGASATPMFSEERMLSKSVDGRRMLLVYRTLGANRYLDSACFVGVDQPATSCR
jgi:hypothetical protein